MFELLAGGWVWKEEGIESEMEESDEHEISDEHDVYDE